MTLWMVSGLHDPRWVSNVVDNYARQTVKDRRLIIVENGIGAGHAADDVRSGVVVMQSAPGPAQPLNVALSWLRVHAKPNDWFVKVDSDDYYGPEYLHSITRAIEAGADYAGRSSLYIRTTDDHLWYAAGKPDAYVFHGPTIAGRVSTALDFPVVKDWGEDAEWCLAMHSAGRTCKVLPPEGVCYQRWAGYQHTWPCTDEEIRGAWDTEFFDLGPVDLQIVNGIKARPAGDPLGILDTPWSQFMPFRLLREQLLKQGPGTAV